MTDSLDTSEREAVEPTAPIKLITRTEEKEQYPLVRLPEWAPDMDTSSALAKFIYDNEPAGPQANVFRDQLVAAIQEVLEKVSANLTRLTVHDTPPRDQG